MQNREKLRQKGHDGSRKTRCRERREKYHLQEGEELFLDRNIDPRSKAEGCKHTYLHGLGESSVL
jgi:hypothetical protein